LHKIKGGAPHETAKAMTYEDIAVTIDDHVHAAKCAIQAGFDAVEIVIYLTPSLLLLLFNIHFRHQEMAICVTNFSIPTPTTVPTLTVEAKRTVQD
jgi:hypothetical protein